MPRVICQFSTSEDEFASTMLLWRLFLGHALSNNAHKNQHTPDLLLKGVLCSCRQLH
jgi:hypothetical protein